MSVMVDLTHVTRTLATAPGVLTTLLDLTAISVLLVTMEILSMVNLVNPVSVQQVKTLVRMRMQHAHANLLHR